MNRRALVQSAAFIPFPLFGLSPVREIRTSLRVEREMYVNMIVNAHVTHATAEHFRESWAGRPFETVGEWYEQSREMRALPSSLAEMPGALSFHTALYGEAAEHIEYLVGAFRRDHICCIVRIDTDDESLMFAIAEHIATQSTPGLFEVTWSSAQLRRFIPDSEDLGTDVEVVQAFFP